MAGRLPATLGVAALILLLDQVTKAIAVAQLEGKPAVQLIGALLQLHLTRNPGAAFSLAGGYTILISVLAIGVTFAIVHTARTLSNLWWAIVLGGILGGALGNLMDRLFRDPAPFRGHVVDFLQLPHWPVFNVADMALVGSAILAVALSLLGVEMTDPEPGDGLSAPLPDAAATQPATSHGDGGETVPDSGATAADAPGRPDA